MKFIKILLALTLAFSISFADSTKKELTFEIKDLNGTVYHVVNKDDGMDIKELKGKVVFLAFFGHRCPPCRMEIPGFINYTKDKDYAEKSAILALEVQGLPRDSLESFVKDNGMNYIVVPGSENMDFIDYVGFRTKWNNTIPFMVVLDQNGTVVYFGNGIVSEEELKMMVDKLYQKQPEVSSTENNITENNTTK